MLTDRRRDSPLSQAVGELIPAMWLVGGTGNNWSGVKACGYWR